MRATLIKKLGASAAALTVGLALLSTPVLAAGGGHGGFGGGGSWHGGGGHWHGGGGGWHGGGGGWRGGGWGPGYGAALGAGLLGGAIIASQYPYYYGNDYGYNAYYNGYPQDGGLDSPAACAAHFKSYDPASETYLGYDGQRHSCP